MNLYKHGLFRTCMVLVFLVAGPAGMISRASAASEVRYAESWGKHGFTLESQSSSGVTVNYSIEEFSFTDLAVDGESMVNIEFPGNLLFNDEGAPNLPGSGRFLAIPEGASARINISASRKETISNVNIAPAPRIPWETEDGPLEFHKDKQIYTKDAFYPEKPVQLSEVTQIRGVDAVMLGITPFQYNPVTKELIIYRDLKVEVTFDGGSGTFGEDRLRSRWWDPLMADMFMNCESLPKVDYNKSFQASESTGFEYLIVIPTDEEFVAWADSIKAFRTLQGISTGIMTVEDCGGNNAGTLENFFDDAYYNWDVPPSAVLIVGDYGSNGANRITSPIYDSYCVSDNIWADVSGNHMPDIIFARMTAQDEEQLEVMVTKFLDYERDPPADPDFYSKPITALGFQTERWFQICSESVAGFWENEQGRSPVRINKTYSGSPLTDPWSTATNTGTVLNVFGPDGLGYIPATPGLVNCTWNGTAQHVIDAINAGAFMLQHRDHGNETGWGEPAFQSSHISNLTNTELTFVWSVNCLTGKFNNGTEVFAEKFHRYTYNGQNSGALAINAASETSYSFVNDAYVWGAYDNMWPDFLPDYGSTPGERGLLPAFACAAGKYFLEQSSWPFNASDKEVTYNLFHHHGDAFTMVYSAVPEYLSVNHDPVLYAGVTAFDVEANEGAFIALTVNGSIIGTAEATGEPVSINIPGQMPTDTVTITITKQNYYRYIARVEVVPQEGPYVVKDSYVIEDETGNNNGLMDYGETVLLSLTVENVGVELAENVVVSISSTDEFITISDDEETYGNIPAGSTATVVGGFEMMVSNDMPDGHDVVVEVSATNGAETWLSGIVIPGHAPELKYAGYTINDAAGNGNGVLDPGETVDILVDIVNTGSADAYNVEGFLFEEDPFLEFINESAVFGDVTNGEAVSAVFTAEAGELAPLGHQAAVSFDMEGDLGISGSGSIELRIGRIPLLILDLDGNSNSAPAMEQALGDLEITYETAASFPPGLDLYESVFICLGVYPDNHVLTGAEGQLLADFLNAGGSLYMEGSETWYYDNPTAVHSMFNIDGIVDGSSDMGTIQGQEGTFTQDMSFTYSGDNNWMDHIDPINPAFSILKNQSPSYGTGVAYDAGNYRTIGTSHEFGGLTDGTFPSTRKQLMNEYISFLGIDVSMQAFFGSGSTEACATESVEFFDQSLGNVVSWEWTFEGGNPATSTLQNPVVTYQAVGSYDVTLEVSDGDATDILVMEDYIAVTDEPSQSALPEGEDEVCTNSTAFTGYSTAGAEFATEYLWEIEPAQAGSIDGNGLNATVSWTANWEGTAYISVKGVNDCGEGILSDELQVSCWICTGVADLRKESAIAIFPNPSNGSFTIQFGDDFGETEIRVVNLLNQEIYLHRTETHPGSEVFIDLDNDANGIYFVRLKNQKTEVIRKIIIR